MTDREAIEFLRECVKICVGSIDATTNPAVANAAQALAMRCDAVEKTLDAAEARTDGAASRLRKSASKQLRALAYTIGGFTPAVRLDEEQRRRVEQIIEGNTGESASP